MFPALSRIDFLRGVFKRPSSQQQVREEEEEKEEGPTAIQEDTSAFVLKVLESLSLQDHHFPGNEDRDNSPTHARIPKSYIPNTPMPSIAVSKGTASRPKRNNKEINVNSGTHIRASSVPRPRAVLSSPDNDGMIGSSNKLANEKRQSALKTCNSGQNILAQGNPILKKESLANVRRISKEAGSRTPTKGAKNATDLTASMQKVNLRKGKPSTVGM